MHSHDHGHKDLTVRRLIYSIFLNFAITASEIAGGLLSNSLSLISDALHNLTDTFAMVISLFARLISKKPISPSKTFGYKRAEIIAAFINITVLIAISLFLFKEAFYRIFNPAEINGSLMFVIAVIGLAGNLISAVLLYKSAKNNINIKSAFIHILSDALSSIAVILTGILIIFKEWYILDPVLTFLIGIYVMIQSWHMLMKVIHILMQGAPSNVNLDILKNKTETVEGVKNIHHIHIWSLTEELIHFEAHVSINTCDLEKIEAIKGSIKAILREDFNISHSTIEFETENCTSPGTFGQ